MPRWRNGAPCGCWWCHVRTPRGPASRASRPGDDTPPVLPHPPGSHPPVHFRGSSRRHRWQRGGAVPPGSRSTGRPPRRRFAQVRLPQLRHSKQHLERVHLVQMHLHQVPGGWVHRIQYLPSEAGTKPFWHYHELVSPPHEGYPDSLSQSTLQVVVLRMCELRHWSPSCRKTGEESLSSGTGAVPVSDQVFKYCRRTNYLVHRHPLLSGVRDGNVTRAEAHRRYTRLVEQRGVRPRTHTFDSHGLRHTREASGDCTYHRRVYRYIRRVLRT